MHYVVTERGNEAISMIKSIIDEAMEKRDRTVSVFISGENMHVTVAPLGEDEPRWIPKEGGYLCSVCGRWQGDASRYCCDCGEALKNMDMFDDESEDEEDDDRIEEKTKGVDFSKSCGKCKHRWDAVRNMMKEIETGEDTDEDNICEHCYNYDEFEPEISEKGEKEDAD